MCDGVMERGKGWRGWSDLPPQPAVSGTGHWLDLTHPLGETTPAASVFPRPQFQRIKSLPADPLNVTEIRMVVHVGTHVDAPRHFYIDGPGVVLRIEAEPLEEIGASHLERARPEVRPGDIVALDTGWSAHAGSPLYGRHPYLGVSAAHWLIERKVKLLACDFTTPDQPVDRRPPGFDWPVHHALLGSGVLICENLTGHRALAGRRAELMFLALNIDASDGAPARVVGRPLAG
jgi:kynurenine formamidase